MSFSHITIGDRAPHEVNVIVEIPRGSRNKYEYSEEMAIMALDRVLHSSFVYPTDYGFIPHTLSEDGDHLDMLVLITQPTFPGCLISVRPIGVLDLEDEAGKDWKIVGVATTDPYYYDVTDLDQMNPHLKKEIKHFFEAYKYLEKNKKTIVREWHSRSRAHEIIEEAQIRFNQ